MICLAAKYSITSFADNSTLTWANIGVSGIGTWRSFRVGCFIETQYCFISTKKKLPQEVKVGNSILNYGERLFPKVSFQKTILFFVFFVMSNSKVRKALCTIKAVCLLNLRQIAFLALRDHHQMQNMQPNTDNYQLLTVSGTKWTLYKTNISVKRRNTKIE